MNLNDIAASLSAGIVVQVSPDSRYIATGLEYPDGDSINIYLDDMHIHDGGLTAEKLWNRGVRISSGHKPMLEYVRARFAIEIGDRGIRKRITPDTVGRDCLEYCEAIVVLLGLVYHKQEQREPRLRTELDEFMDRDIRPHRGFTRDWTAAKVDPKGVFPVDYRLNGIGRPRNVFFVQTSAKTELVAAVTGFLSLRGLRTPTLSVVDPESSVGNKKAERLELISDTICYGIRGNEERIVDFSLNCD